MKRTCVFAFALAALTSGIQTAEKTNSTRKTVLLASGGSNCPVYYGCPAPPPPAPKGGGGGNGGGGNGGGGNGGADNPQPHA